VRVVLKKNMHFGSSQVSLDLHVLVSFNFLGQQQNKRSGSALI